MEPRPGRPSRDATLDAPIDVPSATAAACGPVDAPPTRDADAPVARRALAAALALGVLADLLLRRLPWGASLPIAIAAALAALGWLAHRRARPLTLGAVLLGATALLLALGAAWRDAETVVALTVLALVTVLCALAAAVLHGDALPIERAGPLRYAAGAVRTVRRVAFGAPALALRVARARERPSTAARGGAGTVLRGAALAAPALLVFGMLLAAADRTFARLAERLVWWDVGAVVGHVVVGGVAAWLAGGWLYAALLAPEAGDADAALVRRGRDVAAALRIGAREVCVALVLVDVLFVAFGALQLGWLFGGARALQAAGVTVAEYARRGFFELVAVGALALPLLAVAHGAVDADRDVDARVRERVFPAAAGTLVALVLVLLVSAADRMRLYLDAFGLTASRLYASALMAWLGLVLAWAAATLLRGRPAPFALGTAVSAWAAVLALHVLNPEARIVAVNTARAAAGRPFDVQYVAGLGADAVPALVARTWPVVVARGDPAERCVLARALARERARLDAARDWRTANVARARARRALARLPALADAARACAPVRADRTAP